MSEVMKLSELGKGKAFVLTAEMARAIEHEVAHYPDSKAASIEALKIVQKHHGYVPDGAYEPVAKCPVKIEDDAIYTRDDRWD